MLKVALVVAAVPNDVVVAVVAVAVAADDVVVAVANN